MQQCNSEITIWYDLDVLIAHHALVGGVRGAHVEEHLLLLVHLLHPLRNLWMTQATEYRRLFFHLVDVVEDDDQEDEEDAFHQEEEHVQEEDEGAGQQQEEEQEEGVAVGPGLLGELLQRLQVGGGLDGKVGPHLPHSIHQSLKAGHLDSWRFLEVKI